MAKIIATCRNNVSNTGTRFYYLVNIIADDDISGHADGLAPPSNVLNAAGL